MKREFRYIKHHLNLNIKKCIIYSQLKRILQEIDFEDFNSLNNDFFDKQIVKKIGIGNLLMEKNYVEQKTNYQDKNAVKIWCKKSNIKIKKV